MKRFIWTSYVSVTAETIEEAVELTDSAFPDVETWYEVAPGVEVWTPGGAPDTVEEHEDYEDRCICPPDLVARGGFKGGCPVHQASAAGGKP